MGATDMGTTSGTAGELSWGEGRKEGAGGWQRRARHVSYLRWSRSFLRTHRQRQHRYEYGHTAQMHSAREKLTAKQKEKGKLLWINHKNDRYRIAKQGKLNYG